MVLTCTNHAADQRNREELSHIASAPHTYLGCITADFDVEKIRLPALVNLVLKYGTQVMFTKNDDNQRWVNGTIGTV